MNKRITISLPPEVKSILTRIMEHGGQAYVVGGAVRDAILGRPISDWDVATSLHPDETEKLFSHTRTIPIGKKYGTVIVVINNLSVQVTTYRGEGEYRDFRHPSQVVFLSDIIDDLSRRDFTINALAYNPYLTPSLLDPFGGIDDLTEKTVRAVGEPGERFSEDPLRILRGIRFCAELEFQLEHQTLEAARTYGHLLSQIPAERIKDEIDRILLVPDPYYPLTLLRQLGIFKILLPDIWKCCSSSSPSSCKLSDRLSLIFKAVSLCRQDIVLRLAALHYTWNIDKLFNYAYTTKSDKSQMEDRCAETTELSLKRLRYDSKTVRRVKSLLATVPLPLNLNKAEAEYRLRRIMGKLGPEDTLKFLDLQQAYLSAADHKPEAYNIQQYKRITEEIISRGDPVTVSQLAINGNDLLDAGIGVKDRRIIGKALNQAYQWVLMNPEDNDRQLLLSRLKAVFMEHNGKQKNNN